MKDNKVNVEVIVPSIGKKFSVFIPVNKTVGEVIVILNNTIDQLTGFFPFNKKLSLFGVLENKIFDCNVEIINSGIKNGSILVLN